MFQGGGTEKVFVLNSPWVNEGVLRYLIFIMFKALLLKRSELESQLV